MVHYKRWIVKYKIGREVHYSSVAAPNRKAARGIFSIDLNYKVISVKLQYPEYESASYRRRHLR